MSCEVTKELLAFLKRVEGVRNRVYLDSVNKPTVGVGHLILPEDHLHVGDLISDAQVDTFLAKDVQSALGAVNRLVTVPLSNPMCVALTSFVFNLGEGNFRKSQLLHQLNLGRYTATAEEFGKWVKGGRPPRVIAGLVNRRRAEKELFLSDVPAVKV